MDTSPHTPPSPDSEVQLTKKERKALRREEKFAERTSAGRKKTVNRFAYIGIGCAVVVAVIGGIVWLASKSPSPSEEDILARGGLHWHPELSIYIKGERQDIPANIGLGVTHNPIHTHDDTGIIHLEFSGIVKKNDTRLAKFFEVWGKRFDNSCIFTYCTGEEGTLRMRVNDEENTEFGQYLMQDGDKIEIRFE
jgi:hypothetical protein